MNNEIKVSLSVVLQGRTMLSQEAAKALEQGMMSLIWRCQMQKVRTEK